MISDISVYLDYNATAPARPEVIEAVTDTMELGPTNPSSVHARGREARRRVEKARNEIAALVSARADQVVFTMGGTEANNLVLAGCDSSRFLVSAVEHAAVLRAAMTDEQDAEIIPVSNDGVVDLYALERMLEANTAVTLVSVMTANNETGILQPIAEVVDIAKRYGAKVHTDAVQAAGKITLDFPSWDVDFMTLSAHKIGGPQGVGAVVCRERDMLRPIIIGGGQEQGSRAGTENVAGIVGFGVASRLAMAEAQQTNGYMAALRDRMEETLRQEVPRVNIFGAGVARLPNTSSLTMPGVRNDKQVMEFDLAGVAVSAGSACSAGKIEFSHVLEAMGVDIEEAATTIRVSLGAETTQSDLDQFLTVWLELWGRESRWCDRDNTRYVA